MKVEYSIPNISCNHCVQTIQTEIGELEGVSFVKADSTSKRVEIEFEDPASESGIKLLLSEINYPVEV
ncbi:heavy-metal-associated domain-containing protein [Chloroflexota bacterium]